MAAPVSRLSWNQFFALRRQRVMMQRGLGVPAAVVSAAGTAAFAMPFTDPTQPIFGMDPAVIVSAGALAVGLVGYVVGGAVTGVVWRAVRGKVTMGQIDAMEKDFLHRIARLRANPEGQLLNQPAKDYYGEKIHSTADFRKWLRHHRNHIIQTDIQLAAKRSQRATSASH